MTLEQLEAYRANRTELEAVGDELAGYETQIAVQSAAEFPYSLHTATQSGLPNVPRVNTLLARQARLRACCEAVERFAESVDDSELRMIIKLRYMTQGRKPSWKEIALKLEYRSEHTPYRKLTGFLLNTHKTGEYRTTRPDTDNLNKLLKDCMTELGFWKDDAQVASEIIEKFWAEIPGIWIRVEKL